MLANFSSIQKNPHTLPRAAFRLTAQKYDFFWNGKHYSSQLFLSIRTFALAKSKSLQYSSHFTLAYLHLSIGPNKQLSHSLTFPSGISTTNTLFSLFLSIALPIYHCGTFLTIIRHKKSGYLKPHSISNLIILRETHSQDLSAFLTLQRLMLAKFSLKIFAKHLAKVNQSVIISAIHLQRAPITTFFIFPQSSCALFP